MRQVDAYKARGKKDRGLTSGGSMTNDRKGFLQFLAFLAIILGYFYLFDSHKQWADIHEVESSGNLVILSLSYGESGKYGKVRTEEFFIELESPSDTRKVAEEIRRLNPQARADNGWDIQVNRMGNGIIDYAGAYYWEIKRVD